MVKVRGSRSGEGSRFRGVKIVVKVRGQDRGSRSGVKVMRLRSGV